MFMFNNERRIIRENYLSKKKRLLYPYIPVKDIKKKEKTEVEEINVNTMDNSMSIESFNLSSYSSWQNYNQVVQEKLDITTNDIIVNTETTKPVTKKVKSNITVSKHPYNGKYDFKIEFLTINSYTDHIGIVKYSTDNCQLSSLRMARNILSVQDSDKKELINTIKANVLDQFIVDINNNYAKQIEEFFKDYVDIVIKTPYVSTNSSEMILYILKWKKKRRTRGYTFLN